MSHMSASVTSEPCAGTSAATTTATTAALAHGSSSAGCRHEGGVKAIGCIEANNKRGGHDTGGGGGCGAGVRLQDFWAALNVVRPASLVGHSVGMWGGDVGQQVRWLAIADREAVMLYVEVLLVLLHLAHDTGW